MIEPDGLPREADNGSLTRYILVVLTMLVALLVIYLTVAAFSLAMLDDPSPWLAHRGALEGALGTALLVADAVLPVPSSLIMMSNGALFGVFAGSALSTVGSIGAAMVGYALGQWAGPPLLRWVCSETERVRVDALMRRWGALAVAASRPVPLLAETVAVAAGSSKLGARRTFVAAAAGSAPAALVYAVAGAAGVSTPSGLLVFGVVLAVAFVLWLVGRRTGTVVEH